MSEPAVHAELEQAYRRWEEPTKKWFDSLPLWVRLHPDLPGVWDQVIANRMIDGVGLLQAELEACLKSRDKQREDSGRPPHTVNVPALGKVFVADPLRRWMLNYLAEIDTAPVGGAESREAVEDLIDALFPFGTTL